MIKFSNKIAFIVFATAFIFVALLSCKKDKSEETILTGSTAIIVDESVLPIAEDQVAVFESQYDAKIKLIAQSEKEGIQSFISNKAQTIIIPRKLNKIESNYFKNKKITPLQTPFAIDAIALVKNNISKDTIQDLSEIIDFLKGNPTKIKGLVFDNANSSTTQTLLELAGLKNIPENGVYSFNTNSEVMEYVSQNQGMIGIVGMNWIVQPNQKIKKALEKITVLNVKGLQSNEYVYPSQENLANRTYPLARVLYIINCQGYDGLGIGFASFMAGETGQRIILKSGLVPMREPSRNIRIRNKIEN